MPFSDVAPGLDLLADGRMNSFLLWTAAALHVLRSLHTVPLLRGTDTFSPRASLVLPLARPMTTSLCTIALPLALFAALSTAFLSILPTILSTHSTISQSLALFRAASVAAAEPRAFIGVNGTMLQPGQMALNATTLGPFDYKLMAGAMASGWQSVIEANSDAWVKLAAIAVLLVLMVVVETRVFIRYWRLVDVSA